MCSSHLTAASLALLAALVGCARKPAADRGAEEPEKESPLAALTRSRERGEPPPAEEEVFAPLPPLPAAPAKYPQTHGGMVARTLDAVADEMLKEKPDEGVVGNKGMDSKALARIDRTLDELPKPAIHNYGVARVTVDATADRALIDAAFERVWAACGQYRELLHRRKVQDIIRFQKMAGASGQLLGRQQREMMVPAPKGYKVTGGAADEKWTTKEWDWYEVDAAGARAKWLVMSRMFVTGRVRFQDELDFGSMGGAAVRLGGSAGRLKLGAIGPAVFDLAEMTAAEVDIHAGHDAAIVRVGPGIKKLTVSLDRGLILIRGAPALRIDSMIVPDHPVGVVAY